MADSLSLPGPRVPLVDGQGFATLAWFQYLRGLSVAPATTAAADVSGFLPNTVSITPGTGIRVAGTLANGSVNVSLDTLTNTTGGTFKLIARDSYGRISQSDDGTAADVPVDNSGWEVMAGDNVQEALDTTDVALLNARSTGVRYGGEVTAGAGVTVDVAAGAGGILDNTDPENPYYTMVSWSAASSVAVSSGTNWVYVDDTGTIGVTTSEPSHDEYRTQINLARVSVTGGAVSGISCVVQPVQQYGPQIWDIFRAYGLAKRDMPLQASGANLNLKIGSGEIYAPGINFQNNATNPHEGSFSTFDTGASDVFRMVKRDAVIPADATTIPVGSYDLAGTITAIPGSTSRASIFTVFRFPQGNVRVLYGQDYYTSLTAAFNALGNYSPTIPVSFREAIVLGYIIATKGATDLTDPAQATFIQSNRFGGIGGAVATAASIAHNDTTSIQGGAASEYYHLTAAAHTILSSFNTALGNYANDAAASAGGVPVGGIYRNGSALQIRVT